MKDVFFHPWVGKNYPNGGIFGKKILVLGESHYCGNEECQGKCGFRAFPEGGCEDFTDKVIKYYLSGRTDKWTPTFRKFERSLVNKETTIEESNEIWQSLAFYNYLQIAMTDTRQGGEYEDYQEAGQAFFEVCEKLLPDLIIVWGTGRLYNNMDMVNTSWESGKELIVDEYSVPNGYYILPNGKKIRVVAVWHPSTSRGYSWDWWYKVLSKECYK